MTGSPLSWEPLPGFSGAGIRSLTLDAPLEIDPEDAAHAHGYQRQPRE